MDNSAFSQRLTLLPKLDTTERALSYITAQKSYTKFYASEGRSYLSSWQLNESQSNNSKQSENDNNLAAEFSFGGTPVLEPRVRKAAPAKSVISVDSSRSGEHERCVRKIAKSLVSVSSSKSSKKRHRQSRPKGKKDGLSVERVNKSKKLTKSKKRVNESPSNSSKADRKMFSAYRIPYSSPLRPEGTAGKEALQAGHYESIFRF